MRVMSNHEQSAEEIFGVVVGLPLEKRADYLADACRGLPELRSAVERLLAQHHRPGGPIDAAPTVADRDLTTLAGTASTVQAMNAGNSFGRYTIIEPLGAGGMGFVYRARDEKLDRDVAVKILAPGVLSGDQARRRFRTEALALAKLSHAHIAAVYDAGQQDGVDYIVMECVQGESLAEKLKSGSLSIRDATSVALQIAEALEEAHEHGIVHRDLKPANVMVTPKGQVKILDFGIAKLLTSKPTDETLSVETRGLIGTPLYMSPEQAQGKAVDTRTDLWGLGVLYYESLTGRPPFLGKSSFAVMRAITDTEAAPLRQFRLDAPPLAEHIVSHAMEKDPAQRYQTAAEVMRDASDLLSRLSGASPAEEMPRKRAFGLVAASAMVVLLLAVAAGFWLYHRSSRRHWAQEEAPAQVADLLSAKKPLAAFLLLEKAQTYLPSNPQLQQLTKDDTLLASITSSPAGATVEMQDYSLPNGPWRLLGVTPLQNIRIPDGYFRWKVSKPGVGESISAPITRAEMNFPLEASEKLPTGMVPVPGGKWTEYIDFVGWLGPYTLPPYYVDRYEVTNRDYQKFVDNRGYENKAYWQNKFTENGHELSWDEAMSRFRDASGRPGPSTWVAGHFPEGQADFPVSGVSWFEASAYAAFAGKRLPVLAQWAKTAALDLSPYVLPVSNISSNALAPVGAYKGIGLYGTYDMAGNVREWVANPVDDNLRFILGGSWKSPSYLYFDPEALSPFDRSDTNGFRCVQNTAPLPEEVEAPIRRVARDFANFKPASDSVFNAYKLLYAYPNTPLNAKVEGVVNETDDWREEKITFDTGYSNERMAAYLFLPKKVRAPYQTVLFFPSARVLFIPDNHGGRDLGDMRFFDYIIQSGRAVMYPIYEDTYERRAKFYFPGGNQNIGLTIDRYKDAARSLDYLATRPDIDSNKMAYLGVSRGSAEGLMVTTLLQDRLKTAVFLDGGYFLGSPPPGGDQADFAPRLKLPVLMVNGRYDYTFPVDKAQDPLFNMLGTPDKDKSHVILETPHDVEQQRPQLVKAVLDWLDRYLGRVND